MPHLTRAEARALLREQRDSKEKRAIQENIDELLGQILAIERRVVEVKNFEVSQKQRRLARWEVADHANLVDELVRFTNALDHSKWRVWSFFEGKDWDTQALIASLIAPRLACMSTAHRRYKYARV